MRQKETFSLLVIPSRLPASVCLKAPLPHGLITNTPLAISLLFGCCSSQVHKASQNKAPGPSKIVPSTSWSLHMACILCVGLVEVTVFHTRKELNHFSDLYWRTDDNHTHQLQKPNLLLSICITSYHWLRRNLMHPLGLTFTLNSRRELIWASRFSDMGI